MIKNQKSTKEKLIEVTLHLLEKKDGSQISIREIAKAAEVNSASISYYFGGKEQLIAEAMAIHGMELLRIFTSLLEETEMNRARVERFAKELMMYLLKYEGAYRTGRQREMQKKQEGEFGCNKEFTNMQMKALTYMLHLLLPQESEEIIMIKAIQFFSSLAYPVIYVDMFEELFEGETLEIFIDQYIKKVVDAVLI